MKVLVLGAGKMVEAILTGLKKTENLSGWMIYSPSGTSASRLAGKVGAGFVKDLDEVKSPDWVMVGCKPQQLKELKETLRGRFKDSLFISILAALSEEDQMKTLGVKSLIRVMPNLPVEFNEGVVLLSSSTSTDRLDSFRSYFSRLGEALIVQEQELEELTLLTGSGPAFFYEFTLNLSRGFSSLTEEQRENLAKQVLKGAGVAVKNSSLSLSLMTDAVTSKGGVTIAVLEEWRRRGLLDLLKKGILAGKMRTEEIKSLLRK
jgi:pyrroline-5-carboxylate reductase